MESMYIIVNRYRPTTRSRVDRIDCIWVNKYECRGQRYLSLSFHVGTSTSRLQSFDYTTRTMVPHPNVRETRSIREAVKILKEYAPEYSVENLKKRIRYNRTAIQSMMRRLQMQEDIAEKMQS